MDGAFENYRGRYRLVLVGTRPPGGGAGNAAAVLANGTNLNKPIVEVETNIGDIRVDGIRLGIARLHRTLDISLNEKCVMCDVQINTQRRNPILYTDNDYKRITDNSVRFSIPDYPPQKMTFSYGAAPVPCKILVSAVLPPEEGAENTEYRFITKSIQIGDMQ